jgi:uncharacterized protein (TIGR00725 family)
MAQRAERPYIAVIGSSEANDRELADAHEVGLCVARAGALLVCGGLGGVMAAACEGAREGGGLSVGILPDADRSRANQYVDVAIATGIGELRNGLIVCASDALIAIGGGWGTLSEIAFAMRTGRALVSLSSWDLPAPADTAIERVASPSEAVDRALALARGRQD